MHQATGSGVAVTTVQPDDPLEPVGEVPWRDFPLWGLLSLAENIFKELLVPAGPENATAAHHAKATTLRLVLCELVERAARIHPPQPLTCACGEVLMTIDEIDRHLWDAFVPSNDIGLDGRRHGELAASNEKRLTAQAPLRCQGFVLASGFRLVAARRGVGDAEAQVLDVVDGLVQQGGDVVVVEGVDDVLA